VGVQVFRLFPPHTFRPHLPFLQGGGSQEVGNLASIFDFDTLCFRNGAIYRKSRKWRSANDKHMSQPIHYTRSRSYGQRSRLHCTVANIRMTDFKL